MAEAIDGVREFGDDRRVDFGRIVEHERIDHRLDAAREFLEHHVLILHFGAEPRGLEQALAVPHQARRIGRDRGHVDQQPFVEEGEVAASGGREDRRLVGFDGPVMLRMEDRVHRGQRDILIAAPVAGDEVRIEQFVVVGQVVAVVGDQLGGVDDPVAVAVDVDIGGLRMRGRAGL